VSLEVHARINYGQKPLPLLGSSDGHDLARLRSVTGQVLPTLDTGPLDLDPTRTTEPGERPDLESRPVSTVTLPIWWGR
jgi:hypothetical protein